MLLRISLSFAKLPDMEVDNFAQGVVDGMTGIAAYPAPASHDGEPANC